MWLGITDIKNELKKDLILFFNRYNFHFKNGFNGINIGFKEASKIDYFFISFGVFSTGKIMVHPIGKYINKVERILYNVKLPDKDERHYLDNFNPLIFKTLTESNIDLGILNSDTIFSSQDIAIFSENIINYFELQGLEFIRNNITIEQIYNQILKNWIQGTLEPIKNGSDQYFKALIILKLMNDPNIEEYKRQFKDKLALYKQPEAWLAAFDSLISLLDDNNFMESML